MEGSFLAGKEETPKAWSIPVLRAAQVCCHSPPGLPIAAIGCCVAPHKQTVWRVAHTGLASGQTLQGRWAKGAYPAAAPQGETQVCGPQTIGSAFLTGTADDVEIMKN